MGNPPLRAALALASLVLLAGCFGGGPRQDAGAGLGPSSRAGGGCVDAVVHFAGGIPAALGRLDGIRGCALDVGRHALEPSMGVAPDGTLYYQVFDPPNTVNDRSAVLRSTDRGEHWEDVSPDVGPTGISRHPTSGDPFLWVDPITGRVFTSDFLPPCTELSWSDDQGATWSSTVFACDMLDHQGMTTGVPVTSSPTGYADIVYYCAPETRLGSSCVKSTDGGQTFLPITGQAFPPLLGAENLATPCNGGGHGHPHTGADGTLYLGKGNYGPGCDQPYVAVSKDEGMTWTRTQVAGTGSPWHEADAAADSAGNVYVAWIGMDLLPYLAVSTDGGATWDDPVMVGAPGVNEASQPGLVAGAPGKVAVTYMGTTTSPRGRCADQCSSADYADTLWDGYVTVTDRAAGSAPVFASVAIGSGDDHLVQGACSQSRCGLIGDFHDVAVGPDGSVWAALSDACFEGSCSHPIATGGYATRGTVARLDGFSLTG